MTAEEMDDMLNRDCDIYDAPVDENYVRGWVTTIFVNESKQKFDRLRVCMERTNAYAVIPTQYRFDDAELHKTYVVAYVVHKDEWQHEMFMHYILSYKKYELRYELPREPHAWFHKGWIRKEFDPDYLYSENNRTWKKYLSDKTYREIMHRRAKKKECYVPISQTDKNCNYKKRRNWQLCAKCPNSRMYDRYDIYGRCIIKLADLKKK